MDTVEKETTAPKMNIIRDFQNFRQLPPKYICSNANVFLYIQEIISNSYNFTNMLFYSWNMTSISTLESDLPYTVKGRFGSTCFYINAYSVRCHNYFYGC